MNLDAWADSTDNGVRYTDIQVQTGWRTFRCYHFFTVDTPRAVLQNQVSLSYNDYADVWDAAGQILWEKNGAMFAAELCLEKSVRTSFFGESATYTALFSYPLFTADPPGLVRLHSLLCSRRMARQRLHSPLSDAGPAEPIPLCTTA